MHFRELYDYRQGLGQKLEIRDIRVKLRDMSGRAVEVVKTQLAREFLLGYYISGRNEDCLFIGTTPGASVVVLSSELNECWARFVELKELLHLLDDPWHSTNSAAELEDLILNMTPGQKNMNNQVRSEYACMWVAIALMCREEDRIEFARLREAGQISDYEIALQLKMPERFVPALFSKDFKEITGGIIDGE